ncbi:hypothetical protein [Clostridium sp.]|uniref:hypothetical protein n=1 Tax=Clostridium sp. TaxID=1506 RepID=UPI001EBF7B1C|nr:hypothetical protein [Clostridium sp.]MBS5883968.1 hypothetical protein [Clostridium sp.]
MKNINKALKISIALIGLSLIITLLVLSKLKLDKPVFLKNYKEVGIIENEGVLSNSGVDIELKYISNREDRRKVNSIIFKEAPELNFYASENSSMGLMSFYDYSNDNIESHGRYGVHTVFLTLNPQNYEYDLDKELVLSEATVTFNDGLTMDVDLGKILLYKYGGEKNSLQDSGVEVSSDGNSRTIFWVTDYIKVSNVYSPLFEDTKDLFHFNIDKLGSMDKRDLIYDKNEHLFFSFQFYNIDDIEKKLCSYEIEPVIYFTDKSGKEYEKRVYNTFDYKPYFSFSDIYKYLKVKGEI